MGTAAERVDEDRPARAEVEEIENGFRVRLTEEYSIEVWRMLFNWRLVILEPDQQVSVWHGYCFFGTDLTSLARAIAAGLAWEDPMHTDPPDFDKKAF